MRSEKSDRVRGSLGISVWERDKERKRLMMKHRGHLLSHFLSAEASTHCLTASEQPYYTALDITTFSTCLHTHTHTEKKYKLNICMYFIFIYSTTHFQCFRLKVKMAGSNLYTDLLPICLPKMRNQSHEEGWSSQTDYSLSFFFFIKSKFELRKNYLPSLEQCSAAQLPEAGAVQ